LWFYADDFSLNNLTRPDADMHMPVYNTDTSDNIALPGREEKYS